MPDRRAHQQARRADATCRTATTGRRRRAAGSSRSSKSVSGTFLELNQGAVVSRHFKRATSSAAKASSARRPSTFWKARSRSSSRRRIAHVQDRRAARTGFFSRLTSTLAGRRQDRREEEASDATASPSTPRSICPTTIRSPSSGPGDLFGEMTCMSFYPRSATVRADDGLRRARDAAQRARHPAAQQDVQGAARRNYRAARARQPPAQRADVRRRSSRRVHRRACASASSWCASARAR